MDNLQTTYIGVRRCGCVLTIFRESSQAQLSNDVIDDWHSRGLKIEKVTWDVASSFLVEKCSHKRKDITRKYKKPVKVHCDFCDRPFVKINKNHRFCNRSCRYCASRGGVPFKDRGWYWDENLDRLVKPEDELKKIRAEEAAKKELDRIEKEAKRRIEENKVIEQKPKPKVPYDRDLFIKPRKRLRPNYIQDRRRNPTPEQREFIMKRDGGICQYCGEPGDIIDHILPFSHGGRTILSNLACACERCNSMLGNKVFGSFSEKRSWTLQELDRRYSG